MKTSKSVILDTHLQTLPRVDLKDEPNLPEVSKYVYSLNQIKDDTFQVYRSVMGSQENKELICEFPLPGKYKVTNLAKTCGNRFFFVLQNLEAKPNNRRTVFELVDKELFCYGLAEGLVSFVAKKIARINFTESFAVIYNPNIRNADATSPNLLVYDLASKVRILQGPYGTIYDPEMNQMKPKRIYPRLLPIFSIQMHFGPNPVVDLNENERIISITLGNGCKRVIPLTQS